MLRDRRTTNFQILPLQIYLHVLVHAGVLNLWVQQSSLCSILPDFKVCQATFVEKVVVMGHSNLIGKVSTFHRSQEFICRNVDFLQNFSGELFPFCNHFILSEDVFLWSYVYCLVQGARIINGLNCICCDIIFIHKYCCMVINMSEL
jgi:hypothetical protein